MVRLAALCGESDAQSTRVGREADFMLCIFEQLILLILFTLCPKRIIFLNSKFLCFLFLLLPPPVTF